MHDMFEFKKIDGVVTLVCFVKNAQNFVVPDSYEGEPVTAIGDRAFDGSKMVSIELPDSIESIGASAFNYCSSLKDFKLPKNLKIVKKNAFFGCSSLTEITFPIGVEKIPANCFGCCESLKAVFAENENAVLGKEAIGNFSELDEISFHLIKTLDTDNQNKFVLKIIDDWSNIEQDKKDAVLSLIKKKKSLREFLFLMGKGTIITFLLDNKINPNLDATYKYLEYYIKEDNTGITAILLDYKNNNFKKEKIQARKERKELVEIGLETMTYSEFRKVWSCSKKDGGISISGYKGNKTEEVIPVEVEGIPITMFTHNQKENYTPIQTLYIEANIETLVNACFVETDLVKVKLPDTLKVIGDSAFYFCENLTEIVLPETLETIEESAFNSCSKLTSITIPKSVTFLGEKSFAFCEALTRVEILASIETIPERAFSDCPLLEEVVISPSVRFIDDRAFNGCLKLKKVTFLGDTPRFGDNAFGCTPFEKELHKLMGGCKFVVLKENSAALWNYYGEDVDVVVPEVFDGNNVTFVEYSAFTDENCEKIETLVLPKYLEFYLDILSKKLINLRKITFLNEETNVNSKSFEYLENLEEINLFAWKFLSKQQLCNVVAKIINDWDTLSLKEQKQILYTIKKSPKNKKKLFLSEKSIVVAFLIDQTININLETLNEFLEYYNENGNALITAMLLDYKNKKFSKEVIEKAKEADELVEIGLELPTRKQLKQKWNVGNVAGGLRISGYKGTNTTETIPTGTVEGDVIVAIGSSKTNDFQPIQSLVIDAKIEVLSERTFENCKSLRSVRLPDTLKSIEFKAFSECSNLDEIVIPDGVEIIGHYAFINCSSLETIIIPNSVTTLKTNSFNSCDKLKNITLPASIKEIRDCMFWYCYELKELIIPNSVEIIHQFVFAECKSLEKIVLPKSLKMIDNGAFYGCTNLKEVEFNSEVELGVDVFKYTKLSIGTIEDEEFS